MVNGVPIGALEPIGIGAGTKLALRMASEEREVCKWVCTSGLCKGCAKRRPKAT